MLDLDDARWAELQHAYGSAADIPPLLRELAAFPPDGGADAEPYFSLWSALCHQGDVYQASYAAVPHIIQMMEAAPGGAPWSPLALVTSIEIARVKGNGPELDGDLMPAYQAALKRLPALLSALALQEWDELFARVAAASLAAAKGHVTLAEAILELEPDLVPDFLDWMTER